MLNVLMFKNGNRLQKPVPKYGFEFIEHRTRL